MAPNQKLRWAWFESGRALGLLDAELVAYLDAKWGVVETHSLTSEQITEDIEVFTALAAMGASRITKKECA